MKNFFWGLFFIAAGAFVVTNQFVHYTDINLFSLLLTIFIIPIMVKSLFKLNFGGILFPAAFLCIIYSKPLHIGSITPWPVLLAALLGTIGLSILFHKHHCYYKKYHFEKHHHHHHEHFSEVINGEDSDEISVDVNFGSTIKYVSSDNFKVANLRSNFGSIKIYFDKANIIEDKATINIDIAFSGIELYVPKEWKIINKVDSTLGGVEYKNSNDAETKKTVTLLGRANLAGVEIIYI